MIVFVYPPPAPRRCKTGPAFLPSHPIQFLIHLLLYPLPFFPTSTNPLSISLFIYGLLLITLVHLSSHFLLIFFPLCFYTVYSSNPPLFAPHSSTQCSTLIGRRVYSGPFFTPLWYIPSFVCLSSYYCFLRLSRTYTMRPSVYTFLQSFTYPFIYCFWLRGEEDFSIV